VAAGAAARPGGRAGHGRAATRLDAAPVPLHSNPGPTHVLTDETGGCRGLVDSGDPYAAHPALDLRSWPEPTDRLLLREAYLHGRTPGAEWEAVWTVAVVFADMGALSGPTLSAAPAAALWWSGSAGCEYPPREPGGRGHRLGELVGLLQGTGAPREAAPVTLEVVAAFQRIPRDALGDPWDRFIGATRMALALPLVTRDRKITELDLVGSRRCARRACRRGSEG
jgi:hypothetical protein